MSNAYPSHLSLAEYEFLRDLLPAAKPGGRPRAVELWAILKAIFDLIAEGGQGRALPGDFPAWPTVYTDCRNGRKEGTGLNIHDRLREWVSIAQERQPSPSEAVIDHPSVNSAAGVQPSVGLAAGQQIKGRQRFRTVDPLG